MFLKFPDKSGGILLITAATIGGGTLRFDFDFTNHNMEAFVSRDAGKPIIDYHEAVAPHNTIAHPPSRASCSSDDVPRSDERTGQLPALLSCSFRCARGALTWCGQEAQGKR